MNIIRHRQLFYLKLLAVALVIFGARLWLIHNFGSSVPYWDQWDSEAAFLLLPWLNDSLAFSDLFAVHNEHRIFFTRIQTLLLLILNEGQWNPLLEMVVNALLATLTAIILIVILNHLLGRSVQNLILISIALLWSLPYGWESILGGFHSCWYLMILFSLIALWGLLLHDHLTWKWWIGALCAFFAYLNLATGFFVLIVIIVLKLYLLIIDSEKRKAHIPTLIVSSIILMICITLTVTLPIYSVMVAHSTGPYEFIQAFSKALAWPWINHPFFSLVLYLPFLALVFRILWLRRQPSRAELFVLALGGWVILQAGSMAYARGGGAVAPASRYMDILALGVIINLLAFYFMAQSWYGLPDKIKPYLNTPVCLWQLGVMIGIIWLIVMETLPAIQLKSAQNIEQLKNTREFIRSGELNVLQNKPFLHIPYPNPKRLASLLANPQLRAILPHSLAVPTLLKSHQDDSTFVANGFYPTTGEYLNETTLGSYNRRGNPAMGRFESTLINLEHSFMEISVAGYLGEKDLTLQLVVEGQAEPIVITPPKLAREGWVSCYVRTPNQPFKLVAIDNRPDLWFAFAMPRGVGRLSFWAMWMLKHGHISFFLGLLLLGLLHCNNGFCFQKKNSLPSIRKI
jgi:hypothetical protein